MSDIIKYINEIKERKEVSEKELSQQVFNNISSNISDEYGSSNYLGHHTFFISYNLRGFYTNSLPDENDVEYQGIESYLNNLSEDNSFENDYPLVEESLMSSINAEDDDGYSPTYIGTFRQIVFGALDEITKIEKITPGEYFYLYNSLKKTREEFVDDFI